MTDQDDLTSEEAEERDAGAKPKSQRLREPGQLRKEYAEREKCAKGHPWTPETTRWRRRVRNGNENLAPERDCVICKKDSERRRLARLKEAKAVTAALLEQPTDAERPSGVEPISGMEQHLALGQSPALGQLPAPVQRPALDRPPAEPIA